MILLSSSFIPMIWFKILILGFTKIFKGISEGMTKKVFKAEFKKNKSDYRGVELGNGITWVLAQSNAILIPFKLNEDGKFCFNILI